MAPCRSSFSSSTTRCSPSEHRGVLSCTYSLLLSRQTPLRRQSPTWKRKPNTPWERQGSHANHEPGGEALPCPPPRYPGATHLLHPLVLRARAARGLGLGARFGLGARLRGWRLGPGPALGRRGHGGAAQALRGRKAAGGARDGAGWGGTGTGMGMVCGGGCVGRLAGFGSLWEGFGAPLRAAGVVWAQGSASGSPGVCLGGAWALLRRTKLSFKCVLVTPPCQPPPCQPAPGRCRGCGKGSGARKQALVLVVKKFLKKCLSTELEEASASCLRRG